LLPIVTVKTFLYSTRHFFNPVSVNPSILVVVVVVVGGGGGGGGGVVIL